MSIDTDKSGAYEDNIRGVEPGLYVICHLCENNKSMKISSFAKHINEQHPDQAHEAKQWLSYSESLKDKAGRHHRMQFQAALIVGDTDDSQSAVAKPPSVLEASSSSGGATSKSAHAASLFSAVAKPPSVAAASPSDVARSPPVVAKTSSIAAQPDLGAAGSPMPVQPAHLRVVATDVAARAHSLGIAHEHHAAYVAAAASFNTTSKF